MTQPQTNTQLACQLINTMRGDRDRIQWLQHPDRAAAVLKLVYLSGLPIHAFAEQIGLSGATLGRFERGLTSSKRPWEDLKKFHTLEDGALFQRVSEEEMPEDLRTALRTLAESLPSTPSSAPTQEGTSGLAQRVAVLRKEGRVNWAEHRVLREDLHAAWMDWLEEGGSSSGYFKEVGIHRDVLTSKPKRKLTKKARKLGKKATKKEATKKEATKKEAHVDALELSPIGVEFEVEDDGALVGHCEIRLSPGTALYAEVIRHYVKDGGGEKKILFRFS